MPIKAENKHRYPANWREIRAAGGTVAALATLPAAIGGLLAVAAGQLTGAVLDIADRPTGRTEFDFPGTPGTAPAPGATNTGDGLPKAHP